MGGGRKGRELKEGAARKGKILRDEKHFKLRKRKKRRAKGVGEMKKRRRIGVGEEGIKKVRDREKPAIMKSRTSERQFSGSTQKKVNFQVALKKNAKFRNS